MYLWATRGEKRPGSAAIGGIDKTLIPIFDECLGFLAVTIRTLCQGPVLTMRKGEVPSRKRVLKVLGLISLGKEALRMGEV